MARPPVVQEIYERRIRLDYSIREAARRGGISEGSWRRTESERKLKRTDETIARMAGAVNMTPAELAAAGWPQAARYLDTLLRPAEPQPASEITMAELKASIDHLNRNMDLLIRRAARQEEEDPDEDNGSRHAV